MPEPKTAAPHALLLAGPPGRSQIRFALAAVLFSVATFVIVVPLATLPVARVPAFIPAYESALAICFVITAALLFGQYNFSQRPALLVLASGYLFTACIVVAHILSFPGVFSATGLLGAGPQTSVWLYVFWHGGFPFFVLGYALLDRHASEPGAGSDAASAQPGDNTAGIVLAATIALTGVCGMTLLASAGQALLPTLLLEDHPTPTLAALGYAFWLLSLLALFSLWRRRPRTMLDLWLMVVLCGWLFEVALFVIFNTARFDLGWYASRLYGLLAASSLLIVLLLETATQNARLAQLTHELSEANRALEQLSLHDALTTLANRRFFDAYLAAQIAIARRHGRALALVMCDVDAFKPYNDDYGHQAGDECLKRIAVALQSCCHRPADMVARYGGEEFALILPETTSADAARIAEEARRAVAELKMLHASAPAAAQISISAGVAVLDGDMSAQQLIRAADRNLFEAKRLGRNRVVS